MLAYITSAFKQPDHLVKGKFSICRKAYKTGAAWWYNVPGLPDFDINTEKFLRFDDGTICQKITEDLEPKTIQKIPSTVGNIFKLGDDKEYAIPQLRVFPNGSQLPGKIQMTESGMKFLIKKEHLKAYGHWERVWEHVFSDQKLTDDECFQILSDVLLINYIGIDKYTVAAYGLIDSNIGNVLKHLIDLDTELASLDQKKTIDESIKP